MTTNNLFITAASNDLIHRLARSQARGNRQLGFVNELLAGEAYETTRTIPPPYDYTISYGDSALDHASWKSLYTRLLNNGFIFTFERVGRPRPDLQRKFKITMRFSV